MGGSYEGGWDSLGLRIADALVLPDDEQQLVNWLLRQGEVALADVTAHTGQDQRLVRARLSGLVKQGSVAEVEVEGEVRYRARLARRRGSTLPEHIWRALEEDGVSRDGARRGSLARARELTRQIPARVLGARGRFVLSVTPVALVFLLSGGHLLFLPLFFLLPLGGMFGHRRRHGRFWYRGRRR